MLHPVYPNHCLWLSKVFICSYPSHLWRKLPITGIHFPTFAFWVQTSNMQAQKPWNLLRLWKKKNYLELVTVQFEFQSFLCSWNILLTWNTSELPVLKEFLKDSICSRLKIIDICEICKALKRRQAMVEMICTFIGWNIFGNDEHVVGFFSSVLVFILTVSF